VTPTLRILGGPLAGTELPLTEELIVGRAEAGLDLEDPEVSRRHVALTPAPGGVTVRDLGSSNGTFANGRRLDEPTRLTATTALRIGQTQLELVIEAASAQPTRISRPPDVTVVRQTMPAPPVTAPPTEPSARVASSQPVTGPRAPALAPFGAYAARPERRALRGPATRLIAPAALTALVIIATAVALIVYFTTR
jgi:hypothetical protein